MLLTAQTAKMNITWKKGLQLTTKEEATRVTISSCPAVLPDVFEGAPCLKKVCILGSDRVANISVLLKYPIVQLTMSEGCRDTHTLMRMEKLEYLSIGIFDPRVLSHLRSLKTLDINCTCLAEVLYRLPEALESLTLRKEIDHDIDVRRVSNTSLKSLNIYQCTTSLEFVTKFSHLTKLTIRDVNIRAIGPIVNLHHLTDLTIKNVSNLDMLPLNLDLPNLLQLHIRYCALPNLDFLERVPSVRQLTLKKFITESENFDSVYSMKNLFQLRLDGTNISCLKGIERLKDTLVYLTLTDCRNVEDITPLASFRKLRTLELRGTSVYDISPIGSIRTLRTFSSPETILNGLHCLFGLKRVKVSTSQIAINVYTDEGIRSKHIPLEDKIVSGSVISKAVASIDYVDESVGQTIKCNRS